VQLVVRVADVALGAHPAIRLHRTQQRFVISRRHAVDRENDGGAARVLRPFHDRFGHAPVIGCVELLPDRRAARLRHRLNRRRRDVRQHHLCRASPGRARGTEFRVRMERALARHGRQVDRCRPGSAVDVARGIDSAHVDEAPCTYLVARKRVLIAGHRSVIVVAGRDIAEMRRRQRLAGERLELHDIENLIGGRDRRYRLQKRA